MKKILIFSLIYPVLSLIFERLLLITGFELPRDANVMAIVLLTLIPAASAMTAGFQTKKEFIVVILLTALFTLVFSSFFDSVGTVRPFILRAGSGVLGSLLTYYFTKHNPSNN